MKLASLLVPIALAGAAHAQLSLSWSDGVLGSGVDYSLSGGASGAGYFLLPSLNEGPTPLALLDPFDPRLLDVGLDLLSFADVGFLSAGGSATVSYPFPANPALSGFPLYAQALTFPGAATLADELSNQVKFVLSLPGEAHLALNDDGDARRWPSATTLDDGTVLVAGGQSPDVPPVFHDSISLFDPQTQSFVPSPAALPEARSHHRATLLDDGRVLLSGGIDGAGALASCAIYNPSTGSATATGSMSSPRVMHTATKLGDGRVFVAGGSTGFDAAHPIGWPASMFTALATTEIYNPATGVWSAGPALPAPLTTAEAALLGSGKVLIAGGVESPAGLGPSTTDACLLYDPAGGGGVGLTDPLPDRRMHLGIAPAFTGDVIAVGGADVDFATLSTSVHDDTYVFDHGTETWSSKTPVPQSIRCGQLICIPRGGKVVYGFGAGLNGLDLATGTFNFNRNVWVMDDTYSVWVRGGVLHEDRLGGRFALLEGLRILVIGSGGGAGAAADKSGDVVTGIEPGC